MTPTPPDLTRAELLVELSALSQLMPYLLPPTADGAWAYTKAFTRVQEIIEELEQNSPF